MSIIDLWRSSSAVTRTQLQQFALPAIRMAAAGARAPRGPTGGSPGAGPLDPTGGGRRRRGGAALRLGVVARGDSAR